MLEQVEFWIDIGGTFTDCLARLPDGTIRRHKLLSSGITKGRVGHGSTRFQIFDPARRADPPDFWNGWRLSIIGEDGSELDTTDVIAYDVQANLLCLRMLRHSPAPGSTYELRCDEEAPVIAIRYLLGLPLREPVPPVTLRLGTTRGTNALITRTGARTALVTTRGFGDVLEIGYQARPRLFDLTIRKPETLPSTVLEVDERVTHDGRVFVRPDEASIREQLQALRECGVESLAICFLHADRHPEHERILVAIAREVGFQEISASHLVAPLPKFVSRADTSAVDAYLNPVLRSYVARLRGGLPGSSLRLLTSAGGLVAAENFCGKDSILSGPAGGMVGFSRVAQAAGFERAIGFDMGGTSTDVSRFDGRFELEYETQKSGVRLVAPTMAIETVAAGGGSICRFDGVKFTVGPGSAGADPGPACYGRGGPLTLTDVNFFLGRIVPERFPFPLDRNATKRRLEEVAAAVAEQSNEWLALEQVAAGFLRIANANMAAAIRLVTVAKGANPADYILVAFGGAGPQHSCAVAEELGIGKVLNHPESGVLSALGIGLADVVRHRSCGIERPLEPHTISVARQQLDALQREAVEEVRAEGVAAECVTVMRFLDVRYSGVESYLTIPWPADGDFAEAHAAAHRRRYGYTFDDRQLEIVAARVEVVGRIAHDLPRSESFPPRQPVPSRTVSAYFAGSRQDVPLFERHELESGDRIEGPAIVAEEIATSVIEPEWQAEVLSGGELLMTCERGLGVDRADSSAAYREYQGRPLHEQTDPAAAGGPVLLEVFNNLLANVAEQMGVTLRNTASSVNVKERLDFSCAVFTADGRLVANAPHVPVHLGAMEETVRCIIASNPEMRPGDVFVTNDPYAGGSHLPDITVVTPVHGPASNSAPPDEIGLVENRELRFFTASRAHHAEIGGMAPGSMPPLSTNLAQEGVLIRNLKIVADGHSRFDELRRVLLSGFYPSRDVEANLADVAAQVAANRKGAEDLLALIERFSWPLVERYMNFVQDAAEEKVRRALRKLPQGSRTFTDYLEAADGTSLPITATITIREFGASRRQVDSSKPNEPATLATFDFTGTAPVVTGNLNANRAIVTAAVIYVLRLLVDEDIPLNHGVLRPVEIVLPTCLLNPAPGPTAEATPAVAGGNVETSQRIVDVLLGALGIAGASQGTMNNVIFGDDTFGYYETICGGSGATEAGDGASAVQVHMTNTRLTDPEILERRYPVRVREFAVRRGSGGCGRNRGGNGVVRQLEFLRPMTLSLLTQRRGEHPPYGAAGGGPGATGRNALIQRDGTRVPLPGIAQVQVEAGDILVIETPGGGGFGAPLVEHQ